MEDEYLDSLMEDQLSGGAGYDAFEEEDSDVEDHSGGFEYYGDEFEV